MKAQVGQKTKGLLLFTACSGLTCIHSQRCSLARLSPRGVGRSLTCPHICRPPARLPDCPLAHSFVGGFAHPACCEIPTHLSHWCSCRCCYDRQLCSLKRVPTEPIWKVPMVQSTPLEPRGQGTDGGLFAQGLVRWQGRGEGGKQVSVQARRRGRRKEARARDIFAKTEPLLKLQQPIEPAGEVRSNILPPNLS